MRLPVPRADPHGTPVQRFKPTSGAVTGWAGLAMAAVAIGYVALRVHSVPGLRVLLGAAFAAVLVWATQLRPRVTAYVDGLLIRGAFRDTLVPYRAVDEVTIGQTLSVWVGSRRYVCVGIGRSVARDARRRRRAQARGEGVGLIRGLAPSPAAEAAEDRARGTYQDFVLTRITDLVDRARASHRSGEPVPGVQRRYAVPELAALVATGGGFLVTLLL